jgi:hypothetical protein
LTEQQNKLDRWFLASTVNLILVLLVILKPTLIEHLKVTNYMGKLLILPSNISLNLPGTNTLAYFYLYQCLGKRTYNLLTSCSGARTQRASHYSHSGSYRQGLRHLWTSKNPNTCTFSILGSNIYIEKAYCVLYQ